MTDHLEVILAGLLHDVGKLGQRAHAFGEGLGEEAQRLADYLCPTDQGRPTHQHVIYTAQFVLAHVPFLPAGLDRERVLRLAAYHHRPSHPLESIITEADRLSSGMEREEDESGHLRPSAFRRVRLRAITNEINLRGRAEGLWCHRLTALDPQAAFPFRDDQQAADLTAEYRALWTGLAKDWSRNRLHDPWAFINRALSVLERYTWCVPSATNVYPDISLFDHLKTTAALAGCLAMAGEENPEPFLVVAGDFGGIQDFLFGLRLGAGGLARMLRSRSLFVSLAAENTVHFILRRLQLPLTNCVLSAGGRFTLLLPNIEATQQTLSRARAGLAEWARREVGCRLRPHLASLAVSSEELRDFGVVLTRLGERLEQEKAQPLRDLLVASEGWREEAFVLEPLISGENAGLCDSCQRRAGPLREVRGRSVPLCDRCHEDAEVGRRLVKARYVAFSEEQGSLPFGSFRLADEEKEVGPEPYLVLDLDGGCGEAPEIPVVGRYLARFVPRDKDGSITEFADLASQSRGRKALAYLKADVDNLGLIFSAGFTGAERDRRSISRLTTLSRSLELFFSGYIQGLAADSAQVYTVYSGGDDLLLIGPWDHAVDFALRLREEFRRYTCGSPSWTMSAGLVVVGDKTPVLLAAQEADERLEAAKAWSGKAVLPWRADWRPEGGEAPGKDRLVAFGTALPWERVAEALDRGESLLRWLAEGALNTAQVRRLLSYAHLFQEWQRTGDVLCLRYAPMLVYDLNRNWQHAPAEARQWAGRLSLRDSEDMPILRFACEYALNGVRSAEQEQETP